MTTKDNKSKQWCYEFLCISLCMHLYWYLSTCLCKSNNVFTIITNFYNFVRVGYPLSTGIGEEKTWFSSFRVSASFRQNFWCNSIQLIRENYFSSFWVIFYGVFVSFQWWWLLPAYLWAMILAEIRSDCSWWCVVSAIHSNTTTTNRPAGPVAQAATDIATIVRNVHTATGPLPGQGSKASYIVLS